MRRHVIDEELMLSVDGELPPNRQRRVAHHLGVCQACRDRVDLIRTTMAEADRLYRDEFASVPDAASPGRARLIAALHDAAAVPEGAWFQRVTAGVTGLTVSRSLGVAVVAMVICVAAIIAVRAASEPAVTGVSAEALPASTLTPGAVAEVTAGELCNGVRPSRLVTEAVRAQVVRAYGMEHVPASAYELDALITPELGGSTDAANLWPQRYHATVWNARVKDELERLLPAMVCRGEIALADAQREIAADWIAAYKRHFRTDTPLRAHLGSEPEDDAELLIVADAPAIQVAAVRFATR